MKFQDHDNFSGPEKLLDRVLSSYDMQVENGKHWLFYGLIPMLSSFTQGTLFLERKLEVNRPIALTF